MGFRGVGTTIENFGGWGIPSRPFVAPAPNSDLDFPAIGAYCIGLALGGCDGYPQACSSSAHTLGGEAQHFYPTPSGSDVRQERRDDESPTFGVSWIRLDDQIAHHPKVTQVSPTACWLWVTAIAHAQKFLTDGFIRATSIRALSHIETPEQFIDELVAAKLLDAVDGGYQVHDYLHFNQPAQAVKAKREADRVRKESARNPHGIQAESARTPRSVLARAPASHPIQRDQEQQQQRGEPPVYDGERFAVMPFMQENHKRILGSEAEKFDLHSWYFALDAEWTGKGVIDNTNGKWLERQLLREARKRGLLLGSQDDIDKRANGNGAAARRRAEMPESVRNQHTCRHDPPCHSTTKCIALTIEENRRMP